MRCFLIDAEANRNLGLFLDLTHDFVTTIFAIKYYKGAEKDL